MDSRSPDDVQTFVQAFVDQSHEARRTKFQFAIVLPECGRLIGSTGVRIDPDDSGRGNLGYEIHPDLWGRGYATEATEAMLALGFTSLGLRRIWAECNNENHASLGVLGKLGMRREAVLREHNYYKDRFWDQALFGIDRAEWMGRGGRQ